MKSPIILLTKPNLKPQIKTVLFHFTESIKL